MSIAACPGCIATEIPVARAQADATHRKITLSLPEIHCAACIKGVERCLLAHPEVSQARVNFSLKRVTIHANRALRDADLVACLQNKGFVAYPLNLEKLGQQRKSNLPLRIGVSGFAMMNVMLLSVAVWSGAADATRDLFHLISAVIAVPATLYAAQPFFASARKALRAARMNMDVPIALAILLALLMSVYEALNGGHHAYFDAALSLTFFLLIGRYLDQLMHANAKSAASELAALEPDTVIVERNGTQENLPLSALKQGDLLFLPTGTRLAADGVLEKGKSLLDMSYVTGECDPRPSAKGETLPAGIINLSGPIWVRTSRVGKDNSLSQIAEMIAKAETAKNDYTSIADQAARIYAPLVHVLALAAFVGWMIFSGDLRFSINVAIAVLIITCPCALGLAVPAVATIANTRLFRDGVILKGDNALERLVTIDTVVFDKTGTLSRASFDPARTSIPRTAFPILKALADCTSHPFAQAISEGLSEVTPAKIDAVQEIAGFGITAKYHGQEVKLCASQNAQSTTQFETPQATYPISFEEQYFDWAPGLLGDLRAQGIETILLSGDRQENVDRINQQLGCDIALGKLTPKEKADFVKALQDTGKHVLMVGDGLNDSAALALADASIAPCSALDISRSVADVLILNRSLRAISKALLTSRFSRRLMVENFAIAIVYNLIAIPFALAGLATPLLAAIAMSASSLTVIANSMRGLRL